jgi:hypothetical protein
MKKILVSSVIVFSSLAAFASHKDGSDVPACKGVTDVCMAANVTATDSKTGKPVTGYQPGEHRKDGKGLWADCVSKLAKGEPVEGVTGVSKESAKACQQAEKSAHPKTKKM